MQEGFVEIRHGLAFAEFGEERGTVHAVQCCGGPVQHFDQAERLETGRGGELLKQGLQHRSAQMPDRFAPVERGGRAAPAPRPRPQHPGREHAVEQRLDQGRVKEARPLIALEADAQGFLQGRAYRSQGRRVAHSFDTRQSIARVRGEQPGQVLWFGKLGAV